MFLFVYNQVKHFPAFCKIKAKIKNLVNNYSLICRFNFVSTSSHAHLIKLEFWEMKYRLMAFLMLAESKLKSWIIKYGRRDSVELLLQTYLVSGNYWCCTCGILKLAVSTRLFNLKWMFAFLFQTFVEGHQFFEQYEVIFTGLKQAAEVYVKSDSSSKILLCFTANYNFMQIYIYIYVYVLSVYTEFIHLFGSW